MSTSISENYINNCTFKNNTGDWTGSLYTYNDKYLEITNSLFEDNLARLGSSIYLIVNNEVYIRNCTFLSNIGTSSGVFFI